MINVILFFLAIVSSTVYALDAVITVLETPLFKYRSRQAPVVQYLRKGDVIKIHPSIANDPAMEKYAPAPEKLQALNKRMKESSEYSQDPGFRDEKENAAYLEDEFIPTLDRMGNTVYVLSEHIFVYFNDRREFNQKITKNDPTDYRLEEPLARNYPLNSPSGYRGQFVIGITQPYYESYNYEGDFKTKGYTTPFDLNTTLMKQAPGNYHERLFIGGTFNFRTFTNSYSFPDKRFSEEEWIRLGIGPTISYDSFKGEKNRINLSATIILNLIDRVTITQSLDETEDSRLYKGLSIMPRLSLQYHRKQVFPDLDFVVGTSMEIGLSTSYQAQEAGKQEGWWQSLGADKFSTGATYTLAGYLGFQSAY